MEEIKNNINLEHQNGNGIVVTIGKQVAVPPLGSLLVIPPSATSVGGSTSKLYIYDVEEINVKNNQSGKKLRDQKGLAQHSVLLCPGIYLYDHYTEKK